MRGPERLTAVNGTTLTARYAVAAWEVVDCEDGILRPFTADPTPPNYGLITVVAEQRLASLTAENDRLKATMKRIAATCDGPESHEQRVRRIRALAEDALDDPLNAPLREQQR